MATDIAADPTTETPAPPRHYWQLPAFVLGATALIAAVIYFPPPPSDPAIQFRADVMSLRAAVDHRGISPLTVQQLTAIATATEKVAVAANQHPTLAADASFAAAGGYILLADYGPVDKMMNHWQAAAEELARIDVSALSDAADAKRLGFRQAKVDAALGRGDAATQFEKLANPPVGEDDGGERARLLAEVCLRMTPPNLERARTELTSYLGGPPRLPTKELAQLKLSLADVFVRLKEPDQAKPWLEDVAKSAAPGPLLADARYRLAKLAAGENNWPLAATHLQATIGLEGLLPEQQAAVGYESGLVQLKLGDLKAAGQSFDTLASGSSIYAPAASLRLAELIVRDPSKKSQHSQAVERLETAVRSLKPQVREITGVPSPEAQAAFELVIRTCLDDHDFAGATRAIAAYERIAATQRARELRAETLSAWGDVYDVQGNKTTAAAKYRDAAGEYAALAAADPNPSGQAELLRRAAECHRKSGNTAAALKVIEQIPTITGVSPATAAVAWLNKGEILLASHQYAEAENALQKAMASAGPTATAARVKLALAQIEQGRGKLVAAGSDDGRTSAKGQIALGQEILVQVANLATAEEPVVREAKLQALFELGKLLLQQGSIPDAEARFRQLLQLAPAAESAPMAKLYLGSCLLLLARGDHQGGRPPADADRKLAEARTLFEELADAADPFLQAQADVRLANTTLLLKKYDEMPSLCDRLTKKYEGKVEELIVLSMLYSAYRFADRQADATRTLDRMHEVYAKLTPSDFPGGAEEYTSDYWKRQWFDVLKPMQ